MLAPGGGRMAEEESGYRLALTGFCVIGASCPVSGEPQRKPELLSLPRADVQRSRRGSMR
jgi:hypothetical protein